MKTAALFGIILLLTVSTAHAQAPRGWFQAGTDHTCYAVGVDRAVAHGGRTSAFVKCVNTPVKGFATLMQECDAAPFRGKRIRLIAYVKASNVSGWAGLWCRVDGPGAKVLAFDNMQRRPIKGSSDWHQYSVVLDVVPAADVVSFGLLLEGPGEVWFDDVRIEAVDAQVPTTDTIKRRPVAPHPSNLDFEAP